MATFTNYATLSYNGGTTDSNTVTGELLETLALTKTAVRTVYTAKDNVTYVLSIVNSGSSPITGLTLSDDLGAYVYNEETLYPLTYLDGSIRYYANGVLQTAPAVTSGPPMTISGINVPANGNVLLVYEAVVTNYASLGPAGAITNTATLSNGGLATELSDSETITAEPRTDLNISKSICPATITENGQLSYTFVIQNMGSLAASADDEVALTDTFNPRLSSLSVTFDGTLWTEGLQYTYDSETGVFSTVPGRITVPAATYTQNTDGTWATTPGIATIVISGTV